MQLKTGIAVIGAVVAIGGVTGLYFGLGIGWISLGVVLGVSILSYILAAVGAAGSATGFEEFMRGWLVGLNTGLNGFIAFALIQLLAGTTAGIIVGAVVGLINLLTVFAPISQSEEYYRALKMLRKADTLLVRMPEEYHGRRRPSHQLLQQLYLMGWFEKNRTAESTTAIPTNT